MNEGPRDHQTSLHPTRKRFGLHVPFFPEPESPKVFLDIRGGFGSRNPVVSGLIDDHVVHGFEYPEIELLRYDSHVFTGFGRIGVDIVPVDFDRSGSFLHEPTEYSDGGGFSGPVGPEESKEIALLDGQGNSLKCHDPVRIRFSQVFYGKSYFFGHKKWANKYNLYCIGDERE